MGILLFGYTRNMFSGNVLLKARCLVLAKFLKGKGGGVALTLESSMSWPLQEGCVTLIQWRGLSGFTHSYTTDRIIRDDLLGCNPDT